MKQEMQRISFYGNQILTVEQDGIQYVAMKPLCESIGLTWGSQYNRGKRNQILNPTVFIMKIAAEDGKNREMQMLPVKFLQGWLFSVDANRVKPEIKDRLLDYQKECFDVLNNYWKNKVVQPKTSDVSTAACLSELHVFLELTRGRMHTSTLGNPYNSVSMPTALVLENLYNRPDSDKEMRVSSKAIGHELKIACNTARRAIGRMSSWGFLIKNPVQDKCFG